MGVNSLFFRNYGMSENNVRALAQLYEALAWCLLHSSPDRVVRVRALAGDIVLCSWARHSTLTGSLSTQVYEWMAANLLLWLTLRWTSIASRGGIELLHAVQKPDISAGLIWWATWLVCRPYIKTLLYIRLVLISVWVGKTGICK